VALVAVVLVAVVLATRPGEAGPPVKPPHESPIDVPAIPMTAPTSGCWLGAYVHFQDPRDPASLEAQVNELSAELGRSLAIDHHYVAWGALLTGPLTTFDLRQGMIPMLSWHAISSNRILSGDEDAWIRTQARAIHRFAVPVFIRYGWEMDIHPEWTDGAKAFVQAWRRIHDIFVSEGAVNATWVWSPTSAAFVTGVAQSFYPGPDDVDWIAADGYNWPPGRPQAAWRQFSTIFAGFYPWAKRTGKPLMIAEFGVQERAPGEKAAWIRNMAKALQTEFPAVRAIVYFDSHARYDWRLDSSPEAFGAFRDVADQPYFQAPLAGNVRPTSLPSPPPLSPSPSA
jgi:endoglucanase